jgi:hypothetical protein
MLDIFEVVLDPGKNGAFFCMGTNAFLRPCTAGVYDIPIRFRLLVSLASGVVVS